MADTPEWLSVQGVLVVASKRARESGGGVKVSGRMAVVDGEDVAGAEGLCRGSGHEGIDGEVNLGVLAL